MEACGGILTMKIDADGPAMDCGRRSSPRPARRVLRTRAGLGHIAPSVTIGP
jgi:hypothetical protein